MDAWRSTTTKTTLPNNTAMGLGVTTTSLTIYLKEQWVYIEVNDPFLIDVLRSKIRERGFLINGNFSGSVACIPVEAIIALVKFFIREDNIEEVERKLRA